MASILNEERTSGAAREAEEAQAAGGGADPRDGRTPGQARRHPRPGDRRAHGGGGTRQTAPHRRRAAVRET